MATGATGATGAAGAAVGVFGQPLVDLNSDEGKKLLATKSRHVEAADAEDEKKKDVYLDFLQVRFVVALLSLCCRFG